MTRDNNALWNCGNLAAGTQGRATAFAREISNGLWAPASPASGVGTASSGRPQAGQVHSAPRKPVAPSGPVGATSTTGSPLAVRHGACVFPPNGPR